MLRDFKAVFFDAGGTLLHPYPSVGVIYSDIALKHGCRIDPQQVQDRFRDAWLKRDGLSSLASHTNEKIERQWWRGLVHEVFTSLVQFEDFDQFFTELYDVFARAEYWKVYPGTLEIMARLRKEGKRVGIISNWDSRLFGLCKELKIAEHCEFILASAVFGASKPNPKIFQEALRLTGVAPHEAVHIGDSFEDDIKGARGAGLHAVLIERHPGHRVMEGVPTIHDLGELLAP